MGKKNGDASKRLARSTQSHLSSGLPFVPWSRRIRSRVRSSNNSNHTSPRLVSYFSKVFKQASTETVTELHIGKDERRRTMLHLPLPMRRNNRDHRQEMGTLRTSSARKRWNTPIQQTSRKTSRNKRENTDRSSERPSTNRVSQASSFRRNPAASRISSNQRRE